MEQPKRWQTAAYTAAIFSGLQFVLLTALAMTFYPGGTLTDPATVGYLFFRNFFSDLGVTVAYSGEPNWVSAVLFITALTLAGLGVTLFFVAMPALFTRSRLTTFLAWSSALAGVVCGLSYVGIAWTPANLAMGAHVNFVYSAFISFLVAVIFYTAAIFLQPHYPNRYAAAFIIFAALLAGYIWLLFNGPSAASANGIVIQATGQKLIVYSAILSMTVQGIGARRVALSK